MLKSKLFIAVFFIPLLAISQTRFEKDSLKIVKTCQSILLSPSKIDSIHNRLKIIINNHKTDTILDIYYYNFAKVSFQIGQTEQAMSVAKKGLELYRKDTLSHKASKHHNIIAAVYSFQNSYTEAISEYNKAVAILDHHGDSLNAALVRFNIGNLFFSLSDYESAYQYCKSSMATLNNSNDTSNIAGVTAVVAISAVRLGKIEEGAELTKKSMMLSKKYNNPIGMIVSHLSEGEYQDYLKNYEASKAAYLVSLEYAEKYRQGHYILLDKIGLLKAEMNLKNYQSALNYGLQAMAESDQLSNGNTRYAILKNVSYTYAGLKDFQNAFTLLDSAHNLYKETAGIENKATINELLIQYESEKKEKALIESKLETASQKIKMNKQTNWIISLVGLLAIITLSYYFYRKRQKQKLLLLKENAEKNALLAAIEGEEKERERLANELHDGIASALTGVRLKLEQNTSKTDYAGLIESLKNLHEDTRRISHNLMPLSLSNTSLVDALKKYAAENSNIKTEITVYELTTESLHLPPTIKHTLYRICQEIIQNTLKHSQSPICTVQINSSPALLNISIEDEGIGFDVNNYMKSQGIESIIKRLESINGVITIDSKIGEGTLVHLSILLKP